MMLPTCIHTMHLEFNFAREPKNEDENQKKKNKKNRFCFALIRFKCCVFFD